MDELEIFDVEDVETIEPDEILFDLEEVEKIEAAEMASEPLSDEIEPPDLREILPEEASRIFQEHYEYIKSEAHYRLSLYRNAHLLVDIDDLIHEGYLGFLHGARKYDKTKGASLRTYAGYWVRKYIRFAVKAALINYRYLDYQLNGETTPWLTGNTMSEAEFTFENDYYRTNARLPVYDTKTETIVTRREKMARIRHAINNATDRERKYMTYRYGLDGGDGFSWRKAREHFGQHGKRGEDLELSIRENTEQRLDYGFYDYAEEYWMPHNSNKTDFKGERYVNTLENAAKYKELFRQRKKIKKMKQSALTHHTMTEDEKHIICDWKYSDEYALYNNPPYEAELEQKRGFAHPEFTGYTFYDGEQLIGFTSLYPEESAVMVGIGVAPEYCDKGYGRLMLRITCRRSKRLFPGKQLYLEVRTWNKRAIQCYNRAGFSIDGEPFTQTTGIGEGEFYRMVKK